MPAMLIQYIILTMLKKVAHFGNLKWFISKKIKKMYRENKTIVKL